MSATDYLLLKDPKRCPSCAYRGDYPRNGLCQNCGIRLFPHTHYDFKSFEMGTGMVLWWAFDKDTGWKHRDHFMVAAAKPLTREMKLPKLPKDYGKKTTPEQVAARGGRLTKRMRSKLF